MLDESIIINHLLIMISFVTRLLLHLLASRFKNKGNNDRDSYKEPLRSFFQICLNYILSIVNVKDHRKHKSQENCHIITTLCPLAALTAQCGRDVQFYAT